jgi:hypothetical protein
MLNELQNLHNKSALICQKLDNSYFYLGYKITFENNKIISVIDVHNDYTDVSYIIPCFVVGIIKTLKEERLNDFRQKALFCNTILSKKLRRGKRQKHENELKEITNRILTLN